MYSPNDVVAVGPRSFYVTNDHGSRTKFSRTLEEYLRLARSHVLYFDGENFKRASGGLLYANGINKSPDGRTIYVAAVTAGKIHVYDRDTATGALAPRTQIELGTGVDNIEVDGAGNLWAAAHPKLLTFVKHSKDGSHPSPSQVLKITPTGEKDFQVTEIFLDDGKWLSGASVGAAFENTLLVGPVFDDRFLVCKFAN
jgi:arylesterase/paraoxonase